MGFNGRDGNGVLEGTWSRFLFRRIREKFFLGEYKPQSLMTLCHIMIIKLCYDGIKEFWNSQIV